MPRSLLSFAVCATALTFAMLPLGCSGNRPPATPQLSGPTLCGPGDTLTYTFSTTDPENGQLAYAVAWGDTTAVEWSPPYPNGQQVTRPHVFVTPGMYHVKVKARDSQLAESDWSDSLGVSVVLGSKLVGTLTLQPGQSGDVQNCRVQLFVSSDLSGNPVMEVASKQNTAVNSPFEFNGLVEGYYYLLAWKDLDGDGVVSDKDIAGIHGGTYRPGHGGSQIAAKDGQTTDVGEIAMFVYKELKISASGERVNGGTETNFTYVFNYDVTIASLTITFPGYVPVIEPDAPGAKTAGTSYHSEGWNNGGGQMPTGSHTLEFLGTWEGTAFDILVTVVVD